jgi:hypothetical protein
MFTRWRDEWISLEGHIDFDELLYREFSVSSSSPSPYTNNYNDNNNAMQIDGKEGSRIQNTITSFIRYSKHGSKLVKITLP